MVSTIISIFSAFLGILVLLSIASKSCTSAVICSGIVTFGSITTKLSGNLPLVALASVVRKMSSVRAPRSFKSSVKGLMRMPMKGGSDFAVMPFATSSAACTAVASSSSQLRLPKPSSKSMRKSSSASVRSLWITLL